jgi:hypothetical protein
MVVGARHGGERAGDRKTEELLMLSLLLLDTTDAAELVASVPGCRRSLLLKLNALCNTLSHHLFSLAGIRE